MKFLNSQTSNGCTLESTLRLETNETTFDFHIWVFIQFEKVAKIRYTHLPAYCAPLWIDLSSLTYSYVSVLQYACSITNNLSNMLYNRTDLWKEQNTLKTFLQTLKLSEKFFRGLWPLMQPTHGTTANTDVMYFFH